MIKIIWKKSKKIFYVLLVFILLLSMFGCSKNKSTNINMSLAGGTLTGTGLDASTYAGDDTKEITDRIMYDSLNILVLALKAKKVNVALLDDTVASYITNNDKTLDSLKDISNTTANYAMCFRKEDSDICDEFSAAIIELKNEGVLNSFTDKYIVDVIKGKSIETTTLAHLDGADTIKVGLTGDLPPMDYIDNQGNPSGYNVALLNALSLKLHVNFEPIIIESAARASSLMSGKIDCIFWTQTICKDNDILSSKDIPDNTVITDYYYVAPLSKVFYKADKDIILK